MAVNLNCLQSRKPSLFSNADSKSEVISLFNGGRLLMMEQKEEGSAIGTSELMSPTGRAATFQQSCYR